MQNIIRLIFFYSSLYNVDPQVVSAVIDVESGYKINAISPTGDYGLMQISHKYHKEYTKEQLLDPSINIMLGVKHLAEAKKLSKHKNGLDYLTFYNVGYPSNKFKYPSQHKYVKKVKERLKHYGWK